jgi:hypothetical protein
MTTLIYATHKVPSLKPDDLQWKLATNLAPSPLHPNKKRRTHDGPSCALSIKSGPRTAGAPLPGVAYRPWECQREGAA